MWQIYEHEAFYEWCVSQSGCMDKCDIKTEIDTEHKEGDEGGRNAWWIACDNKQAEAQQMLRERKGNNA